MDDNDDLQIWKSLFLVRAHELYHGKEEKGEWEYLHMDCVFLKYIDSTGTPLDYMYVWHITTSVSSINYVDSRDGKVPSFCEFI